MVIVVSDTSPIRALAHLARLELLGALFERILVPPAVERELRDPPARLTAVDVCGFPFLHVQSPQDRERVASFQEDLDPGEAEALALALEVKAAAILIDERAGRSVAARHGLSVVGTLGVLLRAKDRGLIPAIGPLLKRLENELGFFLSAAVREQVLRRARE